MASPALDGTTNYTNDDTGQLTEADYVGDWQDDESYTYDENGNRTIAGYTTGDANRLLSDGTFTYQYDAEGNRISRTRISGDAADDYTTEYVWDHRNRLQSVTFKNNAGTVTKTVTFTYDANNRWLSETVEIPGETTTQTRYVYDGNQIIAQFDKSGTGSLAATDMSHRYLWNSQAVDQLLADEQVSYDSGFVTDDLLWALTDHQNTVRDLARYSSGTTAIANHRVYDAYGTLQTETNSAVDCLFGYTGRPFSEAAGIQNNLYCPGPRTIDNRREAMTIPTEDGRNT